MRMRLGEGQKCDGWRSVDIVYRVVGVDILLLIGFENRKRERMRQSGWSREYTVVEGWEREGEGVRGVRGNWFLEFTA